MPLPRGRKQDVTVPETVEEYCRNELRQRRHDRRMSTNWAMLGVLRERRLVAEVITGPGEVTRVYAERIGLL